MEENKDQKTTLQFESEDAARKYFADKGAVIFESEDSYKESLSNHLKNNQGAFIEEGEKKVLSTFEKDFAALSGIKRAKDEDFSTYKKRVFDELKNSGSKSAESARAELDALIAEKDGKITEYETKIKTLQSENFNREINYSLNEALANVGLAYESAEEKEAITGKLKGDFLKQYTIEVDGDGSQIVKKGDKVQVDAKKNTRKTLSEVFSEFVSAQSWVKKAAEKQTVDLPPSKGGGLTEDSKNEIEKRVREEAQRRGWLTGDLRIQALKQKLGLPISEQHAQMIKNQGIQV